MHAQTGKKVYTSILLWYKGEGMENNSAGEKVKKRDFMNQSHFAQSGLFTGQYYTDDYITFTDVIQAIGGCLQC